MGIFCGIVSGYFILHLFWAHLNRALEPVFLEGSVAFRVEKAREILEEPDWKCQWTINRKGDLSEMKMFATFWDTLEKEVKVVEIEKKKEGGKWKIVSKPKVWEIKIPGPNSYWMAGHQLLAVKMPFQNNSVKEIVYVPFNEGIDCPELELAGRVYLESVIQRAFAELEKKQIFSRAFPDRLVSHVIPCDLVQNLILTEHFYNNLGKVYVILGANRETAFNYTESNKDALGLTQFIEPTYQSIVELYPEALLETDFQFGMRDHVNAVEAMILLCDANLRLIRKRVREVEPSLVSMYNGGTRKKLPKETRLYLKKYRTIANTIG